MEKRKREREKESATAKENGFCLSRNKWVELFEVRVKCIWLIFQLKLSYTICVRFTQFTKHCILYNDIVNKKRFGCNFYYSFYDSDAQIQLVTQGCNNCKVSHFRRLNHFTETVLKIIFQIKHYLIEKSALKWTNFNKFHQVWIVKRFIITIVVLLVLLSKNVNFLLLMNL